MESRRKSRWGFLLAFLALLLLLLFRDELSRVWREAASQAPSRQTEDRIEPSRPQSPASGVTRQGTYLPVSELSALKREPVRFNLAMRGRVMDTHRNGISGARVEIALQELAATQPPPVASSVADSQGFYRLDMEPTAGIVSLTAAKQGYSSGHLTIDMSGETGLIEKDVILKEAEATLSGRIYGSLGEVIPDAKVGFASGGNAESLYVVAGIRIPASPRGEYSLVDLPAGPGFLMGRAPGYAFSSTRIVLQPGENRQNIRLEAKPTFYITVSNHRGEPINLARAYAVEGKRSHAIGMLSQPGFIDILLTPDITTFNWEVRAFGYLPKAVTGSPKGGRARVVLDDGPLVSGVVQSAAGRPLDKAMVLGLCKGGMGGQTRTDSAGGFSLNVGCPAELSLEVSRPGYVPKLVTVAADEVKQNLVIRLQDPAGGVTGQVLHSDGTPATRFQLQIENENLENSFFVTHGFSDPSGRFSVLDLPAGKLEMQIVAADNDQHEPGMPEMESFALNIRPGMVYSDVIIRLRPVE